MSNHPLRFGIQTGQQDVTFDELATVWRAAEDWGYDSLWCYDHFYPIFTNPKGPCLEGWTTLAALAQITSRARIGHLVNGNTYRNPVVLAKSAVTVDQISKGRLNLGLGTGWFEPEHVSLGFDFKTVKGRLEALEESCQIIEGMLKGGPVTLEGKHYQVREAVGNPLPVQDKLPLMLAGTGPKVLLKLVAKYADQWNAMGSPEVMKGHIDVLAAHCDTIGRDCDEIEKTVMMPICYTEDEALQKLICDLLSGAQGFTPETVRAQSMVGNREACLKKVAAYQAVGVTHFIFMTFPPYDMEGMERFGKEVAGY